MSQLKIKDGNSWVNIPASGIGVPSGGTTGQVLQKSSNTDYATEWATIPSKMVLLWENQNTSEEFASQKINLDLSGYDLVWVKLQYPANICPVGESVYVYQTSFSSSNLQNRWRNFSVDSGGVTFGDCSVRVQGTASTSTNNSLLVPSKIYGIKL